MGDPGQLVQVDPADPTPILFQFRPAGFRAGGQARISSVDRDRAGASSRFDGVDLHNYPLDCLWDSRRTAGVWPGPDLNSLRTRLHLLTIPVGGPDSGRPPPVVRYVPWGTGLDWTVTADWPGAQITTRPADGFILAIRITLMLLQHRPQQATQSAAAAAVEEPNVVEAPAAEEYVVAAGDTLSTIAAKIYGDAGLWTVLWEANKARLKSGDPDLIYPGETILIPPKPA